MILYLKEVTKKKKTRLIGSFLSTHPSSFPFITIIFLPFLWMSWVRDSILFFFTLLVSWSSLWLRVASLPLHHPSYSSLLFLENNTFLASHLPSLLFEWVLWWFMERFIPVGVAFTSSLYLRTFAPSIYPPKQVTASSFFQSYCLLRAFIHWSRFLVFMSFFGRSNEFLTRHPEAFLRHLIWKISFACVFTMESCISFTRRRWNDWKKVVPWEANKKNLFHWIQTQFLFLVYVEKRFSYVLLIRLRERL